MPAGKYDLYLERGATFRLGLTWGSQAVLEDGSTVLDAAYDLTNCKAYMHIRPNVTGEVMLELTHENGITLGDGVDNSENIKILITDEMTSTLVGKRGVYDLEVEFPVGDILRVVEGKVTISPDVTRHVSTLPVSP